MTASLGGWTAFRSPQSHRNELDYPLPRVPRCSGWCRTSCAFPVAGCGWALPEVFDASANATQVLPHCR